MTRWYALAPRLTPHRAGLVHCSPSWQNHTHGVIITTHINPTTSLTHAVPFGLGGASGTYGVETGGVPCIGLGLRSSGLYSRLGLGLGFGFGFEFGLGFVLAFVLGLGLGLGLGLL